jgi:hypothetical protein
MHEVVETIRNEDAADCRVVIEPWGMPLRLPPGRAFKLVAKAPADGKLEIVRKTATVIVYAWPGSTVDVFDAVQLVQQFATPVPTVPRGQSVRGFLDMMFGRGRHAD